MGVTTSIWQLSKNTLALIKAYCAPGVSDGFINREPVHEPTQNVDADVINRMLAGLSEVALRTRHGNTIAVPFKVSNVAAAASGTQIPLAADGDIDDFPAWRGGSVVGAVAILEGACTAGGDNALDITIRNNGTQLANLGGGTGNPTITINDSTATLKVAASQLPGTDVIVALDLIDVVYDSDASFAAGTTPSLIVWVILSFGEEDPL